MSRESHHAIERAKHIGSMNREQQRQFLNSEKSGARIFCAHCCLFGNHRTDDCPSVKPPVVKG